MINRNAYKSLLESVNDAVVGEEEIAEGIKWGDKSIGGARNARELAAWLNSQSKGGKGSTRPSASSAGSVSSGTSVVSEGIKWGDKSIGGARNARELAAWLNSRSKGGKGTRPSASSAGSVSSGASVVSEGIRWGSAAIGYAKNARQLAAFLNRMSGKGGPKATAGGSVSSQTGSSGTSVVSEAKRGLSGRRLSHQLNSMMPAPSAAGGVNKSPSATSAGYARPSSGPSMTVSEDWDILDEILLEGLELYGEEGLAEILADFAETGEISDELALLLSDE